MAPQILVGAIFYLYQMRNKLVILSIFFLSIIIFQACQENTKPQTETPKPKDSTEACVPIKDPNNPKPMALMMRLMAANADSMRSQLLRGETLDSNQYAFIKFYLVEPTDPNVLEPQFFENARMFQSSYHELFKHPKEQKKYYNLMINACINCHESYCSGPLKRIRKFPIE